MPLSPTIPGVWVELDRTNYLVLGQLLLRLQAWQGDVRPYGEAFLGLNHLFTSTTVKSESTGVAEGGVQVVDDQLVYYLHDSYTAYLLWRLGVVFGFN